MGSAEYYIRLTHLPRTVAGKHASGEPIEVWQEANPPKRYDAKPLVLNAGEEIREGVKESSRFLRLELRGAKLPIEAVDRIRLEPSGEIYRLTAAPIRERRATVITVETVT